MSSLDTSILTVMSHRFIYLFIVSLALDEQASRCHFSAGILFVFSHLAALRFVKLAGN